MNERIIAYKALIEADLTVDTNRKALMRALFKDKKIGETVRHFVLSHGGNKDSAQDVFTDSIIAFVLALSKGRAGQIMEAPDAYFHGIMKNICYGHMRKNKRLQAADRLKHSELKTSVPGYISEVESAIVTLLKALDPKCRKVLTLWSLNYKMREIAIAMSYSSADMAKKKKYICLKRLIAILDRQPMLKRELKDR